jgi:hypothetical protein
MHVAQDGGLEAALGADANATVTSLTVTGVIDARDVAFMRDRLPLERIDLSGATVAAYEGTEGTLTGVQQVYPAGVMPYYSFSKGNQGKRSLVEVIFPQGMISIGDRAFYECSGLVSVTIPEEVTYIGARAFEGCTGLTDVYYNAVICGAGTYTNYYPTGPFYEATGRLHLGEKVVSIGSYILNGEFTGDLTIPGSVTSIGLSGITGAFDNEPLLPDPRRCPSPPTPVPIPTVLTAR